MSFRILFSLFILSMSVLTAKAQLSYNAVIQEKIDGFIEASNAGNWDKALDYMYPKMFTQVSKEQLVDLMRQMDGGLEIKMTNTKVTSTKGPVEDGGERFVRVNYTGDMSVKVVPGGMFDDTKPIMGMEQQFKDIYGESNVKYDAATKEFTIRADKSMIAVKGENTDWSLVEINTDQMQLMEYLFSPAVMTALVR